MKTLRSVVIALMFVLVGNARAGVCPTTNVIEDPPEFKWTDSGDYWSGTLEIGQATLTIGSDTLTTRAYGQADNDPATPTSFSIPGPTMRMTPGQTYVLTFKNTLPNQDPSPNHNVFKDPNITNIHTHGLHVSGETPADDITRLINGGYCGDYLYEVPADHMGGTLWYHAHHHGSTYLQVAGGAFGLLIVDGPNDNIPPGVAGMTERLLAIGYLDPTVAGTGGDTLVSGTLSPTWTVNGKVQGNLCTPADEWQHWRVLLADRDARIKTVSVEPTTACQVALLARDGVWRTVAPKELPTNSVDLTGASRADLAVKCSADAAIKVNGTIVANVYADGSLTPDTAVGPYNGGANQLIGTDGTWKAYRPGYLRENLKDAVSVENQSVNMGARTINGDKFDPFVPTFSNITPSVQEWILKGATNHPFHQHIYHMQMQGACGPFEGGEYYDTIACNATMRFDLNTVTSSPYYGRTIMHCHILEHEDQGAMGYYDAPYGAGPGTLPDGHNVLYECGSAPPLPPPPPPPDCSVFTDAKSCNAEPSCSWSGKNKVCEPI